MSTPTTILSISTERGVVSFDFDVDPYTGEVTISADLLDGNAGVAHFGTDVEAGIAAVKSLTERLIRENLAVAPWTEG